MTVIHRSYFNSSQVTANGQRGNYVVDAVDAIFSHKKLSCCQLAVIAVGYNRLKHYCVISILTLFIVITASRSVNKNVMLL